MTIKAKFLYVLAILIVYFAVIDVSRGTPIQDLPFKIPSCSNDPYVIAVIDGGNIMFMGGTYSNKTLNLYGDHNPVTDTLADIGQAIHEVSIDDNPDNFVHYVCK